MTLSQDGELQSCGRVFAPASPSPFVSFLMFQRGKGQPEPPRRRVCGPSGEAAATSLLLRGQGTWGEGKEADLGWGMW